MRRWCPWRLVRLPAEASAPAPPRARAGRRAQDETAAAATGSPRARRQPAAAAGLPRPVRLAAAAQKRAARWWLPSRWTHPARRGAAGPRGTAAYSYLAGDGRNLGGLSRSGMGARDRSRPWVNFTALWNDEGARRAACGRRGRGPDAPGAADVGGWPRARDEVGGGLGLFTLTWRAFPASVGIFGPGTMSWPVTGTWAIPIDRSRAAPSGCGPEAAVPRKRERL